MSLPVPSRTKSMEICSLIRLAVTAGTFLLVASAAQWGPFFFLQELPAHWAPTVSPTEHFRHDEDEYGSAKAATQEQIQEGIACCG
jgi:hypothetical protein